MQILAEKWRVTACVGDRQPRLVEHWYTAAWAYNGLSTTNNPNNPNFSTTRGICRPGACPSRSAPYQERVWGWMEFPPTPGHWRVLRPAYPRLSDLGTASRPPALPDPSCASPTSCTATRAMNVSECLGDGGAPDAGRPDAGPPPMPDAGPPPRPDAGGEVDAGVPVTLPAAPTTFAAPGCGCGAVDGLALGACFALVTARRRRGRNR
jgi:hypothetical protein